MSKANTTVTGEQMQVLVTAFQSVTGWSKASLRRLLGVTESGFAGMLNGSRPAGIALYRSLEAHLALATHLPDVLDALAAARQAHVPESMRG
ncbi:MAG: hypothetical protein IT475_18555 [Aquimonas sp.]|nr:hypothetical protein [Xanthomonadales bacterium]MCC6507436.1 hypothetical protein [Aquimonas sp.]